MSAFRHIILYGTGHTATVLARIFQARTRLPVSLSGRDALKAEALARQLGLPFLPQERIPDSKNALLILAISDKALSQLPLPAVPSLTVVHTAGAVSKTVLAPLSETFGVFYPLQSLRKEIERLPDVPVLIDASDPETLEALRFVALQISEQVVVADDMVRKRLHLAAVVVNNFTNHLYRLAESYCQHHALPFDVLKPLIFETALRLNDRPAAETQTGPAARNDQNTLREHLQLLEDHPELRDIYQKLTESILRSVSGKA